MSSLDGRLRLEAGQDGRRGVRPAGATVIRDRRRVTIFEMSFHVLRFARVRFRWGLDSVRVC